MPFDKTFADADKTASIVPRAKGFDPEGAGIRFAGLKRRPPVRTP